MILRRLLRTLVCALTVTGLAAARPSAVSAAPRGANTQKPFYLKDGDRVVFYGDSITDQRLYTTYIETYCVTRFPGKHFSFIHSGWGGDRVTGGGGGPIDVRLKRDVLAYKPTVVTICLGMNDGSYRAFDNGIYDTYVTGYRHILDTLIKELPGVRITLLTASAYDDVTRPDGFLGGYNSTLVAYGEAVKALAAEYHLTLADTNAPLVSALARAASVDPAGAALILRDRVHPGPGGHVIMASAVLKAWNAPETVAEVQINGTSGAVVSHVNTAVSHVSTMGGKLTFETADRALPWPIDRDPNGNKDTVLTLGASDVETSLNDFTLKVTGLTAIRYLLRSDGADVATVSRADLEAGLDLATLPDLPANKQANEVLNLTRRHNDLHFQRWRVVQVTRDDNGTDPSADKKAKMDALDAQEADAVVHQIAATAPKEHSFELVPAP